MANHKTRKTKNKIKISKYELKINLKEKHGLKIFS